MYRGPHAVADGLPPTDALDVGDAFRHPHSVADRPGRAAVRKLTACLRDEFGRRAGVYSGACRKLATQCKHAAHDKSVTRPKLAARNKIGACFGPGIGHRDPDGHRSASDFSGAAHVSRGDPRHPHGRS